MPQEVYQPPHAVLTSADRGVTWTPVTPPPTLVFRDVEMDDAGIAYAVTSNFPSPETQRLVRSADFGRTWQPVALPGGNVVVDVDVLPNGAVVVARNRTSGTACDGSPSTGEVLVSPDGVEGWRTIGPSAEHIYRVDAFPAAPGAVDADGRPSVVSSLVVYASDRLERPGAGSCLFGPDERLLLSRDGGQTYARSSLVLNGTMTWVDAATLVVAVRDNDIHRTADGGASYTIRSIPVGPGLSSRVSSMEVSGSLLLVQTGGGVIAASTDGGRNFAVEYNSLPGTLVRGDIAHFGDGVAIAFADRGIMRRTE
ncbi:hypothetical protein BH23ACT9_BH23ACT9_28380 [soil metagenome]